MNNDSNTLLHFDVLLFDHVAKKESKLLNKMYRAKRKTGLESKCYSAGNFISLKEVVVEYNWLVSRSAQTPDKVLAAKKCFKKSNADYSTDEDSENDVDLET